MDTAKQLLSELNGLVEAGDVDGGMAALSKIKVSLLGATCLAQPASQHAIC
jgi:hypothetical protein